MSQFGPKFMKDYPLEKGFTQFVQAVEDMLQTDYTKSAHVERMYKKEAFKPNEETIKVALEDQPPVYIDNHGAIYRFLRRCKRLLKSLLKK